MAEDLMRYDLMAQDALRGVIRSALRQVEHDGLPGDHHFYIAFNTKSPGVKISERLLERYPEEMTIVLQHQFWGLEITEDHFSIELSFDNIPEKLTIPFAAIKGFFDPSVQFGLQFETAEANENIEPDHDAIDPDATADQTPGAATPKALPVSDTAKAAEAAAAAAENSNIVKLDAFRKE